MAKNFHPWWKTCIYRLLKLTESPHAILCDFIWYSEKEKALGTRTDQFLPQIGGGRRGWLQKAEWEWGAFRVTGPLCIVITQRHVTIHICQNLPKSRRMTKKCCTVLLGALHYCSFMYMYMYIYLFSWGLPM
jgi:hypothetical protein